ncbi:MAG: peptidoglycan-binding protein [Pseudomonadota bacterium]
MAVAGWRAMTCAAVMAAGMAAAAENGRSVALVVSVGEGQARADAIQAQLQVIGTETLRSVDPNNAELRSLLNRFADEALDSDVGLVYLDATVVSYDGRAFVLPAGARLDRASDIFTRAIPLSAFARATELAGVGGVVMATTEDAPSNSPAEIGSVREAPEALPGLSPVLVAAGGASETVVRVLAAATLVETVELGKVLSRMTEDPGITLSQPPRRPVFLREAAVPEAPAPAPAAVLDPPEPVAEVVVEVVEALPPAEPEPDLTLDELIALENELPRSARRSLQAGLRREGFYSGFIDGILGPQSRSAIETFQIAVGGEATGYLTPDQMTRLFGEDS